MDANALDALLYASDIPVLEFVAFYKFLATFAIKVKLLWKELIPLPPRPQRLALPLIEGTDGEKGFLMKECWSDGL